MLWVAARTLSPCCLLSVTRQAPDFFLTVLIFHPLTFPRSGRAMAAMHRTAVHPYQHRHLEFVQSFVAKRSQKKERPKILSADERAAHRKELGKVQHLQPAYSEETMINISRALRRWTA